MSYDENRMSDLIDGSEIQREEAETKPIIDFAVWYSGMERSKVERAYKRYLKEIKPMKQ